MVSEGANLLKQYGSGRGSRILRGPVWVRSGEGTDFGFQNKFPTSDDGQTLRSSGAGEPSTSYLQRTISRPGVARGEIFQTHLEFLVPGYEGGGGNGSDE